MGRLLVGAGVHEVTGFVPGVGMMGWAHPGNVVEGIETPLLARAFVIEDGDAGRRLGVICAEACFVSALVREDVLARLAASGWDAADLMLCATHTHSGPGGYAGEFVYNVTVPGFVPEVYEALVEGMVAALLAAEAAKVPAACRFAAGSFPPEVPVAFNRALEAHNANRDLERPFLPQEANLAIDREMRLLRFDALDGRPIGLISWFAVHGTSVHRDNRLITPDNKGYAARECEAALAAATAGAFVAAFLQGAAGDVSPNFYHHPGRPFPCGVAADDFESARENGRMQAELALALHGRAGEQPPLEAVLSSALQEVTLSGVEIPPELADGEAGHRTGRPVIGARMLGGTAEGPGLPGALVDVLEWLCRPRGEADTAHAPKAPAIETGRGRALGIEAIVPLLPDLLGGEVRYLKQIARAGGFSALPWTPETLPVQLLRIGPLVLAAVPAEFTTQAGRRLTSTLVRALARTGIQRVLLTGYANAYAGYVTTPEEYDLQGYEGASTLFGRWTLAAYQHGFEELANVLAMPADPEG